MRTITVTGVSLYRVAAQELGSASQWIRIAMANNLYSPLIVGTQTIAIPPRDDTAPKGIPQ